MQGVAKKCLNCKFYRLNGVEQGICRVDKDKSNEYPTKQNDDICTRWLDSGQQYYIRLGWIKAQLDSREAKN